MEEISGRPGQYSPWINQAITYTEQNYGQDITVEKVAAYLQKTPNYVSGVFKKETGVSFTEYLNRLRIERAKELLGDAKIMIYEISEQVGYKDYKYFTTIFTKYTGISPTAYRKEQTMEGKYCPKQ